MTSRELYNLYRQVLDLRDTLSTVDTPSFLSSLLQEAVDHAEEIADELFDAVGKLAASEIEDEYLSKKKY